MALFSGMVFVIKAGILTGTFYIQAGALFLTSIGMALWPNYAHFLFGAVSAACFFVSYSLTPAPFKSMYMAA